MFVCRRLIVRHSFLILLAIVVLFCTKYIIFELLSDRTALHRIQSDIVNPESVELSFNEGNETKRELMLLQMLFRHGHRSPFNTYPNDPNNIFFWKEGMGMLTKLGRLQHYAMGQHLRERYKDFITSNPKEIEMINSDNFRCQYGVYAFIAGLYAPTKEYSFTDEIQWQPIISRSTSWKGNKIFTRGRCPIAEKDVEEHKKSDEAFATKKKYKDFYNFWTKNSGRLIEGWHNAGDLAKTISCERDYNLTVPEWANKYWDELTMQSAIIYYFNFGTRLAQKYNIGPLLGFMAEKINAKILGKIPEKRVFLYSGHGSSIACLMLALDQYDWLVPSHASTVILEFWREDDENNGYSVRWLYFNSSNPERRIAPPIVFHLDGCGGEFCPFPRFMELIGRLIPEDWVNECNDYSQKEKFLPFESAIHIEPGTSIFDPMALRICKITFKTKCLSIMDSCEFSQLTKSPDYLPPPKSVVK